MVDILTSLFSINDDTLYFHYIFLVRLRSKVSSSKFMASGPGSVLGNTKKIYLVLCYF